MPTCSCHIESLSQHAHVSAKASNKPRTALATVNLFSSCRLQVPRLAPPAAISIPAQAPGPGDGGSESQAQQRRPWPLSGVLGTFAGSSGPDSTVPNGGDPQRACAAATAPSDACSTPDDPLEGQLQRARGLKPLEAISKAAGRLTGAVSDEASGQPNGASVESQAEQIGSRAAVVKERLEKAMPEKLRKAKQEVETEAGRWLPGLGAAIGGQATGGTQEDVDGGVEGGLGRLRSKVRDVKDSLSSEDSAVRRFGEKVRDAAGTAAAGRVDGEREGGMDRVCESEGEYVEPGGGSDGAEGAKGLRGLVQKAKSKVGVGDGSGNSARSGCVDQVNERSSGKSDGQKEDKVEDRVPENQRDFTATADGKDLLQVLRLLPTWMMFW